MVTVSKVFEFTLFEISEFREIVSVLILATVPRILNDFVTEGGVTVVVSVSAFDIPQTTPDTMNIARNTLIASICSGWFLKIIFSTICT